MPSYFVTVKYRRPSGLREWSGSVEAPDMATALKRTRERFENLRGVVKVDSVSTSAPALASSMVQP